ncbi:LysE family translocator [Microbispora sp. H11081]|uniref:LysE family translocator n=1 Tax=Microbispora sp. H11081 TaxID=2729107 RepID=UPI00147374EF|nr:LysE family translocator [Microbispora sp. H11081]
MPTLTTLALFAAATLALLVVPGPAVLYIVTRSVAQGRSAGLVSVLGVHAGSLVHIAAAAFGITALLAASATAFAVVKYLGAAYLVYLGIRKLVRRTEAEDAAVTTASNPRLFTEGLVVNVLNPKTAMFFLAFLPQFVDPARGPVAPQVLVLGAVWVALGMASDGTYALLASVLAGRLRSSARARRRLDRGSGVAYLGLGAVAALATEGARKL